MVLYCIYIRLFTHTLLKREKTMKNTTTLIASGMSLACSGFALADLPVQFELAGPGETTIKFHNNASGSLTHFDLAVSYVNGEDYTWVGDILIGIVAPDGTAIEYGGYNMSFGYEVAGDFPEDWDVTDSGDYSIYGVDLSAFGLQGVGDWTIQIANGYTGSNDLNSWDGTLTLGGLIIDGDPVGACCVGKDCMIETQKDCSYNGGDYLGDWTSCDGYPCGGAPIGACCLDIDNCDDSLTEAQCVAFGGKYLGDMTMCEDDSCSAEAGDVCETARVIYANSSNAFDTSTATDSYFGDPDDTQCEGTYLDWDGSPDRWMVFTATGNGTITVDTCDTGSYDTSLVVYEGSDCGGLYQVACNGDSTDIDGCQAYVSYIGDLPVTAGSNYYIRVGGWQAATGTGTVNLEFEDDGSGTVGSCCIGSDCSILSESDCMTSGGTYNGDGTSCAPGTCDTPCEGDTNGDGAVNVADILIVIGEWGSTSGGGGDVDGDGNVNVTDLLLVIANFGGC